MAFIEEQKKGNKKYYYLTKTLRLSNKFKKIRLLLSDRQLSKAKLKSIAKQREKELLQKEIDFKKTCSFFSPACVDKFTFKDKFLVWERPSSLYLVHTAAEALVVPQIKHFGKGWGRTHCFFKGGMVKVIWDMRQVVQAGIFIINDLMDSAYFNKKIGECEKLTKRLKEWYKKLERVELKSVSDKKLIELFRQFHAAFLDWWGITQVSEPVSYASEFLLREVVPAKLFPIITSPTKKSYTTIEEEELLRIAQKVKSNKKALTLFSKDVESIKRGLKNFKDIREMLEKHTKNYFWLQNNYFETKVLAMDHFISEIKTALDTNVDIASFVKNTEARLRKIREEKAKIIKSVSLAAKYKKLVKLLDFFCAFQDERKAVALKAHHYLSIFLNEVSRRTGISRSLLYWCTPYEIPLVLKGKFDVSELKKRQEHMTLIVDVDGMEILTGNTSLKKEKELLGAKSMHGISEFEGMRAQGGKIVGKVVKVLDPREQKRFKEGSILVTTMTSPDFVPIIKKAAAIVTDEGGLTSHASIVAREFGVPCVIGTKISTEVLEDDDTVEVNANHGLVKIIEKCAKKR
jgi:phosphoenolpyruvate synthase/pyruvate phosphate dikinase